MPRPCSPRSTRAGSCSRRRADFGRGTRGMTYVSEPLRQPATPVAGEDVACLVPRIWCVGPNYAGRARKTGHDLTRERRPDRRRTHFRVPPVPGGRRAAGTGRVNTEQEELPWRATCMGGRCSGHPPAPPLFRPIMCLFSGGANDVLEPNGSRSTRDDGGCARAFRPGDRAPEFRLPAEKDARDPQPR